MALLIQVISVCKQQSVVSIIFVILKSGRVAKAKCSSQVGVHVNRGRKKGFLLNKKRQSRCPRCL